MKTYSSYFARPVLGLLAAGLIVMAVAGCTPATTVTLSPTVTMTSTLPETTPPPPPSTAAPTLRDIRIIPPVPYNLLVGFTTPFVATGVFSDQSFKDISTLVKWNSSNPAVATIDSIGQLTGKSPGTTTITASLGSITSQTAIVTVVSPGGK